MNAKKTLRILVVVALMLLCFTCVLTGCADGDKPAETTPVTPGTTTGGDTTADTTTETPDTTTTPPETTTEPEEILPPVDIKGFTIDEDGKIYDPEDNLFVPFGTNLLGPRTWLNRENTQDADLMIDTWKFNIVRLVIVEAPQYFYANGAWGGYTENNDIDKIVDTFTSRKVVVMLDVHDYMGKYPSHKNSPGQKFLEEKWRGYADKYKENPYVWFNIMNEPVSAGSPTPAEWKTAHLGAIKAIRNRGARNIIICDGHNWANDFGNSTGPEYVTERNSCILKYGPSLMEAGDGNVMFSLHSYNWNFAYDKMVNFIETANSKGMAVLLGEVGVEMKRTESEYDLKLSNINGAISAIKVHQDLGAGLIQWAWQDYAFGLTQDETIESGGWEIRLDKDGNPTNLSWLGHQLWNIGHGVKVDVDGYDIAIESVMADQFVDGDTGKTTFVITLSNVGCKTIPSNAIHIKATIGDEVILDEIFTKSIAVGGTCVVLSSRVTPPSEEFTVKVVTTGAEIPAEEPAEGEEPAEPTYYKGMDEEFIETFTLEDPGYYIDSIDAVIPEGETAKPWGKYSVTATIKRTTMSVEDFKKLTGSFYADGMFMCLGTAKVVDDDTLLVESKYTTCKPETFTAKFEVDSESIWLAFKVLGADEGANGALASEVQIEGVGRTSFSSLACGSFDVDMSHKDFFPDAKPGDKVDWAGDYAGTTLQFWNDNAAYCADGMLVLPSETEGGVAFWLEKNEVVPGGSYYVYYKTWFGNDMVEGDAYALSFKYEQYGQWIEIKDKPVESQTAIEYVLEVTIPDDATKFYTSVYKAKDVKGTAYFDYIAIIEK